MYPLSSCNASHPLHIFVCCCNTSFTHFLEIRYLCQRSIHNHFHTLPTKNNQKKEKRPQSSWHHVLAGPKSWKHWNQRIQEGQLQELHWCLGDAAHRYCIAKGNYPDICDNVMLNNIITLSPSMEKRSFVLIQEFKALGQKVWPELGNGSFMYASPSICLKPLKSD